MRNNLLYIVTLALFQINAIAQNNSISLYVENNYSIYNSSLNHIKEKFNYDIKSNTIRLGVNFKLIQRNIIWSAGINIFKTNVTIKDRITHWNYVVANYYGSGGYVYDTIYQVYKDPLDLVSSSINFGFNNEIQIPLKINGNKITHFLGFKNEIYFYEIFKSDFVTSDVIPSSGNVSVNSNTKPFALDESIPLNFITNTNISTFYKLNFHTKDFFSVGLKISCGTNLYNNWDKFKKYAWLGAGLELGFGKKPLFKKKEKI